MGVGTSPENAVQPKPKPAAPHAPIGPWLNPKQCAAYIGLSIPQLEIYRRRGTGPRFARVGARVVRYAIADIDAWLIEHRIQKVSDQTPSERAEVAS